MRRVVVTGMGIVSSIGNNKQEVLNSLKKLNSGISISNEFIEHGLKTNVWGDLKINPEKYIDRKVYRFMADAAAYSYIAMSEAIEHSGLEKSEISHPRTGLIIGSGGASPLTQVVSTDILREFGVRKVGPYAVTKTMGSTTSACLATPFEIKGVNYSISSACSTSAHCIGHAAELIQFNKQDIVFAGGAEELNWSMSMLFDAMGALSTRYNHDPSRASRAFDKDRDGFVISGGGGVLVLEEYSHAKARGATIIAELTGYGATSDGYNMVQPSGEGAIRCMQMALKTSNLSIDYINAHGTSTTIGDIRELEAIREVFGDCIPPISSTKSLTGHALGAAGVNEVIYSLLMLENQFLTASANIDHLDEKAADMPIILQNREAAIQSIMSNSFGFGGTNATLIFSKPY